MVTNSKYLLAPHIHVIGVVAMLILTGTASGEISRAGLVAEYHFEDDVKDSSENGNNGIIYGAAFVDGISGKALRFDGKNDYVDIPYSPSVDISDNITIEAWIQFNEGFTIQTVITKSSIKQTTSFVFPRFDKNNQLAFWLKNETGWKTLNVGNVFPYREWHHVVGTYDGSYMKIYVDRTLIGTLPVSGAITTNTNSLTIGYQPGTSEYFYGMIDEVRIYNRALIADEIKANYDTYQTLYPPRLILTKSLSSSNITEGDTTTITIRVDNTGGDARNVKITDAIPKKFALVSGTATQEYNTLKSTESRIFQYTLKATGPGRFVSDLAAITYDDNKGNSYSSASNPATITVQEDASAPTQQQQVTLPKITGFEVFLAGIGIIIALALRRR